MKNPVKIYLADLVHNHFPGNYVVPLNIANIAVYIKKIFGTDLEIKLFKFPNDLIKALKKDRPDILGLANYFWNSDLNFQIGSYVKRCYPDTVIAMGGPRIRIDNPGIKHFLKANNFVDAYMMFEGEKPFANFLKFVMGSGKKNIFEKGMNIEGCAYLLRDDLIYSAIEAPLDLTTLPSPYLEGMLDEFIEIELVPLFETNRGCPFTCTFCTWGIAAQKKLRQFPVERVFDEMEYVARSNSKIAHWIFADANFGIFERDIKIAERISAIKKKTPALRMIQMWSSKNTTERNLAIARLVHESERQLIAVQTLDPAVEKRIRRENINQNNIIKMISELKHLGIGVSTDVLCGLPGETRVSHLETLRKCFDLGFDSIDVGNVYLLPGSEMETDESRDEFKIKSRYRLRQGSYGAYNGIKSIEYEEVIRSTTSITENEMLNFRLLHWLIWYGWNANFLKPLMLYLQSCYSIHPLDFLVRVIDADKGKFLNIKKMFNRFLLEARDEWFDSPGDLHRFYMQYRRFNNLLKYGSSKINFRYMAEFILNRSLYSEFCDFITSLVTDLTASPSSFSDILVFIKESLIDINKILRKKTTPEEVLRIKKEHLPFILNNTQDFSDLSRPYLEITLYKAKEDIAFVKKMLKKYSFNTNRNFAVEKTLENSITAFSYNVSAGRI